jgi:phosphomannomutase / phosphoglucomutase
MNPSIFREYDIRGLADKELSPDIIADLSRALGTFHKRLGAKTLVVGRDSRVSSPRIAEQMVDGLRSCGVNVIDIGLVPTPLVYFACWNLPVEGGVMITGSHNPPEHNGLKICVGTSSIHGEQVQQIFKLAQSRDFEKGAGQVSRLDIREQYLEKIVSGIRHPLNIHIVADSGNGTAGVVAPELFRRLGCKVEALYSEPDGTFPNHHADPTLPENMEDLIQAVARTGAVAGVGFDGDSDRIGVVDRTGKLIFGDELLVLFARQVLGTHPGATIISEVKASHRLYEDIRKHGGNPVQWKTGHSLIKAKMKETGALLAGEMSGHIFFKDRYFGFDDAIYAAARLFEILSETGKTPLELLSDLPPSFSTPEIRVDCPDEIKFLVVKSARDEFLRRGLSVNDIDGARVEFGDGWGLVRASNTQPVLVYRFEASSQGRLDQIRSTVESVVHDCLSTGG